jgi:hypothetical protein
VSELDAKVQALVVAGKPPSGAEISAPYRGILSPLKVTRPLGHWNAKR